LLVQQPSARDFPSSQAEAPSQENLIAADPFAAEPSCARLVTDHGSTGYGIA
jgi:hypothetical protein